ncbi:MAG TPA: hypothetical protein VNU25_03030 [Candidatus Paceibacterota bacterium]|nr:hypothetical protein [Candidatus Paceibacterota bacterium]
MRNTPWPLVAAVLAGVFAGLYLNMGSLQVFGASDMNEWGFAAIAGVLGGGIYHFVGRQLHRVIVAALALLLAWFLSGLLGAVALAFGIGALAALVIGLFSSKA